MKWFLAILFSVVAFYAIRHFNVTVAWETFELGGTQVAWGWVMVAAAAMTGYLMGKK